MSTAKFFSKLTSRGSPKGSPYRSLDATPSNGVVLERSTVTLPQSSDLVGETQSAAITEPLQAQGVERSLSNGVGKSIELTHSNCRLTVMKKLCRTTLHSQTDNKRWTIQPLYRSLFLQARLRLLLL